MEILPQKLPEVATKVFNVLFSVLQGWEEVSEITLVIFIVYLDNNLMIVVDDQ